MVYQVKDHPEFFVNLNKFLEENKDIIHDFKLKNHITVDGDIVIEFKVEAFDTVYKNDGTS